jgi:ABC-type nitrate/sulfonate/bicarbonate transport system substrate-binding protein
MLEKTTIARRPLLGALGLGALLGSPLFRASPALAEAVKLTAGVGLSQEGGAVVLRMQQEKLLEQAAKELGLDGMAVDYLSFPVLLRMLQGLAAGQLQTGMLGSTPCIRTLAGPDAAVPIALAGGFNTFPLQVPKGSPIKNLDDLKGKSVLTIVGSDLHLVLIRMLEAHFGQGKIASLGIQVRNINILTELGRAPSGIDAVVSLDPIAVTAEEAGDLVTLVRNNGTTGPAYDGPEGKGEGHTVASFKNTPFAPEAYYPHRIWWVVRQEFLQSDPKAVTALLVAAARATTTLAKLDPAEIVKTSSQYWPGSVAAQERWIATVLWKVRGWPWITESDAATLPGLSTTKEIFQTVLEPAKVREILKLGAPAAGEAYKLVGVPDDKAFAATPHDVRGRPLWEIDSWGKL